jgi:carbon monoxide dehydrogenase subunit G
MRKTIQTSHQLQAPAKQIWSTISQASGVDTWLPAIQSCTLTGSGEGAGRICTTEQGDLVERILKIDHDKRVFKYAIDKQPFFPIVQVEGTMSVSGDEKGTRLDWDLSFDISEESAFPMVEAAIQGMYQAGARGLEALSK